MVAEPSWEGRGRRGGGGEGKGEEEEKRRGRGGERVEGGVESNREGEKGEERERVSTHYGKYSTHTSKLVILHTYITHCMSTSAMPQISPCDVTKVETQAKTFVTPQGLHLLKWQIQYLIHGMFEKKLVPSLLIFPVQLTVLTLVARGVLCRHR